MAGLARRALDLTMEMVEEADGPAAARRSGGN
jgi:hypothetical protein